MKSFDAYQDLDDGITMNLTEKQKGSKFWNKGKWDNYIEPMMSEDVKGMTYIDMGCGAGLFLKFAEDKGFGTSIGVELNEKEVKRGLIYKDKVEGKYEFRCMRFEENIDDLPVSDYMSFVNSHYYLLIQDWLKLLDVLQSKTRYVIITATSRREWLCDASARGNNIQRYFRNWHLVKVIEQLPIKDDPCPRSLWTYCYRNPVMERVELKPLIRGHHKPTRDMKKLRKDIEKNGMKDPIIIDGADRILDGNHRRIILTEMGYKTAIVRRI